MWKGEGDVGYEEPCWEYLSLIIAVVNHPVVKNRRSVFSFSDEDYKKACASFAEWKKNGRKQRK